MQRIFSLFVVISDRRRTCLKIAAMGKTTRASATETVGKKATSKFGHKVDKPRVTRRTTVQPASTSGHPSRHSTPAQPTAGQQRSIDNGMEHVVVPGELVNVASFDPYAEITPYTSQQQLPFNLSGVPETGNLMDLTVGDSGLTSDLGVTAMTLPLGAAVGQAIKEKIWKGEFIELSSLLPSNPRNYETGIGTLSLSPSGVVTCMPPKQNHISSIEQWTDAFIVFISIFCIRHPVKVPELLKYMSIVRDAAKKFPGGGWIEYDQQFRRRQACLPNRSWALIDGELWYTVLIPAAVASKSPASGKSFPDQPFRARAPFLGQYHGQSYKQSGFEFGPRAISTPRFGTTRMDPKGICWAFNRNGCFNSSCNWAHVCSKCGLSNHAAGMCRKTEPSAPTNSRM